MPPADRQCLCDHWYSVTPLRFAYSHKDRHTHTYTFQYSRSEVMSRTLRTRNERKKMTSKRKYLDLMFFLLFARFCALFSFPISSSDRKEFHKYSTSKGVSSPYILQRQIVFVWISKSSGINFPQALQYENIMFSTTIGRGCI